MIAKKTNKVKLFNPPEGLPWGLAWAAALALLLARMVYVTWLSPYGLGPDEAQYWHWTHHLDWSYLTKPPLTTANIWFSTSFWGQTALGVKFVALLGQSAVALLGFGMAGLLAGISAAWLAFALLATVPLVAVGGLLMSPDALLLPLWMGALYCLILESKSNILKWNMWVGIGVLIGLAGLAKYAAGVFYPLLFIWMLLGNRAWFKRPQPYAAGLISLLMQVPVIIWNFNHEWAGLHHVLWQTDGGGDTRHGGLATLGDFLGGQALVLGPIILVLLIYSWGKGLARFRALEPRLRLLLVFTVPIVAIFTIQTLHAKVQPNWPLLGTIPALILIPVLLRGRWQGVLILGIILNSLISLTMHDTFLLRSMGLETPYKADPTKDLRGWPEMGRLLAVQVARLDHPVILASRYQTVAQVAFSLPGHPDVLYLNDGTRRPNEYDLWAWPPLDNRLVLYVNEQNNLPAAVSGRFGQCEPWTPLQVEQRSLRTRQLYTWLCWTSRLG